MYLSSGSFQTKYVNIRATYPANFIETADVVQQIQQFKL